MRNIKTKGFTLIELLVVVAIIGILASVVMSSLDSARKKGADAAIKSNLNSIRTQSSIWYDDNGQVYTFEAAPPLDCLTHSTMVDSMFADPKIFAAISAAYTLSGGPENSRCHAGRTTWAAAVQLNTSDGENGPLPDAWCADSVGSVRAVYYQPIGPSYPTGVDISQMINLADYSCYSQP